VTFSLNIDRNVNREYRDIFAVRIKQGAGEIIVKASRVPRVLDVRGDPVLRG
jgi:hypothetical protein